MSTDETVAELSEILESATSDSRIETPEGKQRFIISLMSGIALRAVERVRDGSVPEDWNGIELRKWLADLAGEQVMGKMDRKRLSKYRSARYTFNL